MEVFSCYSLVECAYGANSLFITVLMNIIDFFSLVSSGMITGSFAIALFLFTSSGDSFSGGFSLGSFSGTLCCSLECPVGCHISSSSSLLSSWSYLCLFWSGYIQSSGFSLWASWSLSTSSQFCPWDLCFLSSISILHALV